MSKKVELSAEERAQLVLRMLSKEEPVVQIARRAGIAEQTLYRWRDEFISAGKQAALRRLRRRSWRAWVRSWPSATG